VADRGDDGASGAVEGVAGGDDVDLSRRVGCAGEKTLHKVGAGGVDGGEDDGDVAPGLVSGLLVSAEVSRGKDG
jgi:hypothetical protein